MKIKRILTWVVLAAMALTMIAGCNGDDPKPTETKSPVFEGGLSGGLEHGIPESVRFDGDTFNMYTMNVMYGVTLDDWSDEYYDPSDPMQKAKHDRIVFVEETLGLTVEITNFEGSLFDSSSGMLSIIRTAVNSGFTDWDFVSSVTPIMSQLSYEGAFLPVSELTYVDLDQVWWNREYIETVSLNANEPYILFGDINYNSIDYTLTLAVNEKLLKELKGMEIEELYKIVLDGEWTLDKMYELMEGCYADNGNTKKDAADRFGLVSSRTDYIFEYLAYSAGYQFTGRDEDGYPTLEMNKPTTLTLIDQVGKLVWNNQNYFQILGSDANALAGRAFAEDRSLFYIGRFYDIGAHEFPNMETDYALIPLPKASTTIDNYYTATQELTQWAGILSTVPVERTDLVSAATELMAYCGYRYIIPVYYETNLKLKYTRGDDLDTTSEILDIIRNNARTDFTYVNNAGEINTLFGSICNAGSNMFAGLYARNSARAEAVLDSMKEADLDRLADYNK